jgi:hypothetical protein
MTALPLQVIDNFLLQYSVGQAIFLLFVLGFLAVLPLGSRKVQALHFTSFGLLFMLTPQSMLEAVYWKFLGIALLMLGPMAYITARK